MIVRGVLRLARPEPDDRGIARLRTLLQLPAARVEFTCSVVPIAIAAIAWRPFFVSSLKWQPPKILSRFQRARVLWPPEVPHAMHSAVVSKGVPSSPRTQMDEAGPCEPGFMVKFLIFLTLSDRLGKPHLFDNYIIFNEKISSYL